MSRRERDRDRNRVRDRAGDRDGEGRDSDSKRRHSGFDKEPSPKRSRREGKLETERKLTPSRRNLEGADDDQKQRKRLQDALPLEPPSADSGAKESDKKSNGHNEGEGSKLVSESDPTQVPRSRSYFQHDERGNAGQVGRSFGRRGATERGWRDSKDDRNERATDKSTNYDSQRRDKSQGKVDEVWRHDGFLKMEAEPPPPVRKRPAFREQKIPVETENAGKAPSEPARPNRSDRPPSASERREERDRIPRHLDRYERPAAGDREMQRVGIPSKARYVGGGAGSNYRGRERFNGRQGYHPSGTRGEKWKHDLFDEANRSPTTKNEEDQIAKVEALLAS